MIFVPLTVEHLVEVSRVAAALFPWESEHQEALATALAPEAHRVFLGEHGLASVCCWVALKGNLIAGLACFYVYDDRPDEVWLAWFGLRPEMRGQGKGRQFLDWCIATSRGEGRKILRLWTTNESEYAAARQMYERSGFICENWPALPGEDWTTYVLSLGLDGACPTPWRTVSSPRELCGRVIPDVAVVAA
ncbi:MAG: GNAT family N-acetyltransferase [Opitutaceae bacterium]|nr:GNAT family N-acetyltransferase [Opitutaceae bacterium]